jgi:hypothetical protein
VRPGVSSGERQGYATALTGLWRHLSHALSELDAIASDPEERLTEDALEVLASLRYALHAAAELALGLDPPPAAKAAHAELAGALADARDVTAEIAEAVELGGPAAAEPLVPEWRGALFRVRLARLRAAAPPALPAEPAPTDVELAFGRPAARLAVVLSVLGTAAFAAGAAFAFWPIWSLGIALFAGGVLVYRPRP